MKKIEHKEGVTYEDGSFEHLKTEFKYGYYWFKPSVVFNRIEWPKNENT
jgi:hypothetical protein